MSTESTRHGLVGRVEDQESHNKSAVLQIRFYCKFIRNCSPVEQSFLKGSVLRFLLLIIPALWCKHLKEAALETG